MSEEREQFEEITGSGESPVDSESTLSAMSETREEFDENSETRGSHVDSASTASGENVSQESGADSGSSGQANVVSNLSDLEWRKKRRIITLQQKYIIAYMYKKLNSCPDTRCNNYQPSWNIVGHFIEFHNYIPRTKGELDAIYTNSIKLYELEYGRSHSVAVLFVPLIELEEHDIPDDSSVMPLVVLASKIHPRGNLAYVQFHETARNIAPNTPMKEGDLLMVWVCGHVQSVTCTLEVYNADKTHKHLYSGYVHSIVDNNHDPQSVFLRGNCLLIPASNLKELTDNGIVTLDTILSLRDEDLY